MKKYLPALKRVLDRINPSEYRVVNAVYISPAQRLRQQADDLEQAARDFHEVNQLINELESLPEAESEGGKTPEEGNDSKLREE